MTKDKWGDTGYLVTGSYYPDRPIEVHEVDIDKVTAKCVYANRDVFNCVTGIQSSDCGDKCRLFPDRGSADEYVARCRYLRRLSKYTSTYGEELARRMPVGKIRKIVTMFEAEEDQ